MTDTRQKTAAKNLPISGRGGLCGGFYGEVSRAYKKGGKIVKFYSPLRYPGGKSKLTPLIKSLMAKAGLVNATYIEPFAGGAGVAMSLLLDGTADQVVINDLDKAVYSFWRAVKTESNALIKMIANTQITIDERSRQQTIYRTEKRYSVELAFAALFLNRVNRSGIITGGPIGGHEQNGNWKLNARFNKEAIIDRIAEISRKKNAIVVYNQDVITLIDNFLPKYTANAFIYFDPPYYNKAKRLYKNALTHAAHVRIANRILDYVDCPWLLTYDDVAEIRKLYAERGIKRFDLNYSAANKGKASEIIVCSDFSFLTSLCELNSNTIRLNLRDYEEMS